MSERTDLDLDRPLGDAAADGAGDIPVPAPVGAWRRVLDDAIAAETSGKLGVALRLGVSRPYVSRVTTGHIPQASPRFVARVMALLAQVHCPYLGRMLSPDECRGYASREYERIGAIDVPHWRACQRCEHNPLKAIAAAGLQPEALPPREPVAPAALSAPTRKDPS